MNRYPLWKNLVVVVLLVLGLLYTLPNFFGEVPAVQISSVKATVKVEPALAGLIEQTLAGAGIAHTGLFADHGSVRVRFADTETQLKARDVIERALNPDPRDASYSVALNLLSASPAWMSSIGALPMYLGLDLRGGVHFLLQVDMQGALTKRLDAMTADLRTLLRDKGVRHAGIAREGMTVIVRFRDAEAREKARQALTDAQPDLSLLEGPGSDAEAPFRLIARLKPEAEKRIQDYAMKQNMTTLHNRINELGVTEPVIQQQGMDRIVVQLPGVQDTAKAKDILGRTATLEVRMVDEEASGNGALLEQAARGQVPPGLDYFIERGGRGLFLKRQVVLTGERLTDAQPGFDGQTHEPAVHLTLDAAGSRIFKELTRENIGKRMAILLIEKGKGEVVTAPVIRTEIGGGRVQISGRMTTTEAHDVALLLRAGSLAAPMEIIEERTVGPSLGAENISKGFHSTLWGFVALALFIAVYYALFGVISVVALVANLMLLIALLSLLQATLTLPGIAAIALTLGMAIDANVLINERIREELRAGNSPQAAINAGYERAWGTILDSNITTLIAGLALLIFGSGPVRGFAVVHCLGIMTSMFSAVVVSRAMVNALHGGRKLNKLSIGTVWRPESATSPIGKQ